MWKLLLAFVLFAALAVYMLSKGGNIDMSGEKHGTEATHVEPAASAGSAATPASAASH